MFLRRKFLLDSMTGSRKGLDANLPEHQERPLYRMCCAGRSTRLELSFGIDSFLETFLGRLRSLSPPGIVGEGIPTSVAFVLCELFLTLHESCGGRELLHLLSPL
jgi:hypothetical protein